jgi:sarcosine oxidase
MSYVRRADILIVGAGVMGAATARALRRSGRKVVLLEQFSPGHQRGSSHGRTRIFRYSYPDPAYVRMAQRSLRLWRELESDSGDRLLTTTGGLDLGSGVEANAAALADSGASFELLDGRDVARRFPQVHVAPGEQALFQPEGGVIAAGRSVAAFLRVALAAGAELIDRQRVTRLEVRDESVRALTEHAIFEAPVAVVTAGGWARPLLATAGIELPVRVTRETVAFFELMGEPPPPLVEWGTPSAYSLPSPGQGIKAAQHIAGPETDADDEGGPSSASVQIVTEWIRRRFPNTSDTPHLIETCLYTNTDDESFVLERHGPVVVGSPCSGHGFKFAPLIGERLANLAEGLAA